MKKTNNEQSSARLAKIAAKALASSSSNKTTRSLAGSVLTQAPDRKKSK